jgi:hypothetical protein
MSRRDSILQCRGSLPVPMSHDRRTVTGTYYTLSGIWGIRTGVTRLRFGVEVACTLGSGVRYSLDLKFERRIGREFFAVIV